MRFLTVVVVAICANFLCDSCTTPASAQQCEVRCFTSCSYGRCCRRCARHCSAPRYAPAPEYIPPYNPTPQYEYRYVAPAIDARAIAGVGLVLMLIAAVVAAIIGASRDASLNKEIAAIDASAAAMHAEAHADEWRIHDIQAHIAREERAAFEEGRADAQRRWDLDHRR